MKNTILYIFILILWSKISIGAITIEENSPPYLFDYSHLDFFEDKRQLFSIQNIADADFTSMNLVNKNYGFRSSIYWIRLIITNNTDSELHYLYKITYPLLNDIHFYETCNGIVTDSTITGENRPFDTRQINDRNFIFRITIKPDQTNIYYLRVANIGETTRIPIKIIDLSQKTDFGNTQTFILALFFGFFLFAFILNGILFFVFRQHHYFLLSIYILSMGLFLLIIEGFAFQFLWPNNSFISNHSMVFFAMTSSVTMLLFSNVFLKSSPHIKRMSVLFYILGIFIFIWNMLPYPMNSYSIFASNAYVLIAVFYISYVSFQKYFIFKNHSNLIFALSFICVMISVIIYILRNFGILPISFVTDNSMKIGFSTQITLLTVSTIMQFREIYRKTNKFLENIVSKRTEVISHQNLTLKEQNKKIALQYKELKQSMKYAKRLQNTILPSKYKFSSIFKNHLIIYIPRDIVSGDFYWMSEKDNKTYIITADCTGHGIPGGFLSMLGISFLNQIISKNHDIAPNEILNKLSILFNETMNNDDDLSTRDSMDLSICSYHHGTKVIEYAGAYNPIYIIRNKNLIELKVDKLSLRIDKNEELVQFTNYSFQLEDNDRIFMFSDGFVDQFGGEFDKRFTKKRFKELLLASSKEQMQVQKELVEKTLLEWKGKKEQVDDILVLGIEI